VGWGSRYGHFIWNRNHVLSDMQVDDYGEADRREVIDNAFKFTVSGKRNKINVVNQQSGDATTPAPEESRRWIKIVGGIIGGIIAIAGLIFGLMEVQGWSF
jgi:hypothetical protein